MEFFSSKYKIWVLRPNEKCINGTWTRANIIIYYLKTVSFPNNLILAFHDVLVNFVFILISETFNAITKL